MAEIHPLWALRYDVARVGTLSDVVAPPYDVIDARLQAELYARSPHNIIRLELNREEPGDTDLHNRYTRAADFLKEWCRSGIMRSEDHPALYLYHQSFELEGVSHTRKGFFARVRMERFGKGHIFPHEQTLAGPRADRLKLYQATGTQLSPIFGLYPDNDGDLLTTLERGLRDRTPLEATDDLGVVHRLWPVFDQHVHSTVQGLMAERSIFIADGHHRYETGLAYRDALAAAGELSGPDDPANFCCMALVGMSDPGLIIMPTHRLVSGWAGITSDQLVERLDCEFDLEMIGAGEPAAREAWDRMQRHGGQEILSFGTVADQRWILARLRSDAIMDRLAPEHSPDWRGLGVSILHELVIKHLLGASGAPRFRYVHTLDEVAADIQAQGCDVACLVPPAAMEHLEAIASNRETMPPKSTYFYPKLLTGLVLNPLH